MHLVKRCCAETHIRFEPVNPEPNRLRRRALIPDRHSGLVETTMGRYKMLIGPRLRARGHAAQQTEAAIGVAVLTRMLVAGRPDSVRRRQPVTA
jgi:hypothetical protein